jgi:hypothetical protein
LVLKSWQDSILNINLRNNPIRFSEFSIVRLIIIITALGTDGSKVQILVCLCLQPPEQLFSNPAVVCHYLVLRVTGLQISTYGFQQWHFLKVQHLLWHGTSVYTISPEPIPISHRWDSKPLRNDHHIFTSPL